VLRGDAEDEPAEASASSPSEPAPSAPDPSDAEVREEPARAKPAPKAPVSPVSLARIEWTATSSGPLDDLARSWSIPRDTLASLNPQLARAARVDAGTKVVVYASASAGASASLGPPNDGRLVGGVPLPEGPAWAMPEDRTRAFATAETIAAVTAALQAYGARFPNTTPIQMGDLSARRGGRIYGHQSHQSGRDVDIRLVMDDAGERFDADRNWFLVKTLVDTSDVRQVFLNRSEQAWLRAAADADVGAAKAQAYFDLIDHEPGHTIHMHVRFACAREDKRCVGYSLPDTDEKDKVTPGKIPGTAPKGGASKVPGIRPKSGGAKKKKKKKKKKGKKKTLSPKG
jgi:murein endopeptidase